MSVPDKSIDPRLIQAAKEEFLQKGFEKASLTNICKASGVTTGALYKRYKGKEELFCALVDDTVQSMKDYVAGIESIDLSKYTDQQLYDSFSLSVGGNKEWFKFLYDRKKEFTLLIRCASGTKYENFHQDWTKQMNNIDYKFYQEAKKRGLVTKNLSADEYHVLTFSIWSLFYEPFFLDFTWEQLEKFSETICLFIDLHSATGFNKPE